LEFTKHTKILETYVFTKEMQKKHWKHFFIEIDDYDEEEYSFGSEWVSSLRAVFLKKKQLYKKTIHL